MSIDRSFNLQLQAGRTVQPVINVSQYDSGETWHFTLLNSDGTKYTPASAAIVGKKSDGNLFANACTVTSDGTVEVTETEQMTAAAGKAEFELLIDDQTHGTCNFIVLVEACPTEGGVVSESDLSLIQQAIDSTSATAIAQGVADWMADNLTPTTPVVDASLTVQGAAADSAKVGQEISDLKSQISHSGGLTEEIKLALMDIAEHIGAWTDGNAQTYIENLRSALFPPVDLNSITANFTQSGTIYDIADLEDLRTNLVVTANYSDGTHGSVSQYTLSGTLEAGTSTITVSYREKTTSFDVTVTASLPSGYTKYDYLYQTSSGSKAQNYMINLATYPNLNRISLDMKVKVLSVLGGYAIIGGRSESGSTSSFAFYAYNGYTNGSLSYHIHGVESGTTVGHNIPFDINAVHSLKYTATTESPSVIEVDGETYETEWANDNVINRHLTLLSNTVGTNNQRLSENIQIGRIIIKDENGDVLNRYVPCVQDSSNKIGMYDIDTQTFYTPSKSGVAVIGNSACIYQVGNWS